MPLPPIYIDRLSSPLGMLLLAHGGGHLCALGFQDDENRFRQILTRRFGHLPMEQRSLPESIRDALQAYLGGDTDTLKHVPVHASGTHFQQQVWTTLRTIPAGVTWTCAQLAAAIGQPNASGAISMATAHNPVAIVVPCHRVVGNNGELAAYAGGVKRKHWLLVHEGALAPDEEPPQPSSSERQKNRAMAASF